MFSFKYCEMFRNTYFIEHLRTSAFEPNKIYKLKIYLYHITNEKANDAVKHSIVITFCQRPYHHCHKDVASVAIYTLIDL